MRTFLFRLLVGIVALGALSVFLICAGAWPRVVEAVTAGFGQETAEKVDAFGQGSKDVADQAGQAYEDVRDGNTGQIDFSLVDDLLEHLKPTPPSQRVPEYRRDEFGEPWADTDGNHCDTRNDILARDLTNITKKNACVVLTGTLADPYTGKTIQFLRGESTSAAVQIDHVRALADVWAAGAYAWTDAQRLAYANDPMVLRAVDGPTNTSKSAKGPATWMPPNGAYDCQYVASYVEISAKYGLSIADADRAAIERTLATCS